MVFVACWVLGGGAGAGSRRTSVGVNEGDDLMMG